MHCCQTPNSFASLGNLSLLAASLVGLVSCCMRDSADEIQGQVTRTLKTYVRALSTADTNLLSQVFTDGYCQNHGGLEGWAKRLAKERQKHQGLSLGTVTIEPHASKTNTVFVQFTLGGADEMEGANDSRVWWVFIRDARGNWQVDDVFHDFDPNDLSGQR